MIRLISGQLLDVKSIKDTTSILIALVVVSMGAVLSLRGRPDIPVLHFSTRSPVSITVRKSKGSSEYTQITLRDFVTSRYAHEPTKRSSSLTCILHPTAGVRVLAPLLSQHGIYSSKFICPMYSEQMPITLFIPVVTFKHYTRCWAIFLQWIKSYITGMSYCSCVRHFMVN